MAEHHSNLVAWEASFRLAAQADANSILSEHLAKFGLRGSPDLLLEGTIEFVRACVAFANLDGHSSDEFLDLQTYDPRAAIGATYALTFDVFDRGFARVLTPSDLRGPDLADLYGIPWDRYERVGYERFWLSRTDGDDLSRVELEALELAVTEDLRFDYAEDELDFWFDPDTYPGALLVAVQDHIEIDD